MNEMPGNLAELEEQSSLLFWFLDVKDILPVPKTLVLVLSEPEKEELISALDDKPLSKELIGRLTTYGAKTGYPLFLRTDNISGKHSWKDTCYVPDEKSLVVHALSLIEESMCAGFMGVSFDAFVFRQFLSLETTFNAFHGDMPVSKERRYFVRDGKVVCHHSYWPEDSIRPPSSRILPDDWKARLTKLNDESPDEVKHLTGLAEKWPHPDYWSIDFACDKEGNWWFIDAARGELSWHPEDCPFNPRPRKKEQKPDGMLLEFFTKKRE